MPADITHPVVAPCQPPDSNIKIWRYMDVTKLVALMETRSLHFARADTLQDPFEGSVALVNQIVTDQIFTQILKDMENNPSNEIECTLDQMRKNFAQITRRIRQWMFMSCWHSGDFERSCDVEAVRVVGRFRRYPKYLPNTSGCPSFGNLYQDRRVSDCS